MQIADRRGREVRRRDRPGHDEGLLLRRRATAKRSATKRFRPTCSTKPKMLAAQMLEALSMYSDELMEMLLSEEEVPEELIHEIVRASRASARTSRPCSWARPIRTKACSRCWTRSCATCPRRWSAKSAARIRRTKPTKIDPLEPDPTQAVRRHGVQDRRRCVRPVDVHADLPRHDRQGRHLLQPAHRPEGTLQPHRERCTPTSAKKSIRPRPATSSPSWASTAPAAIPTPANANYLHAGKHVRSRAGDQDVRSRR